MSDEREPLWTNQRIRDRYHALLPSEANMGEMEYWRTLRDVGERVSYELRNDYEARITELEAQLAESREDYRVADNENGRLREFKQLLEAQLAEQPAIPPDVRERLADYAHEAWSGWMRYMFTIGTLLNDKWMSPEPGQQAKLLLPEWAVERWQRQMNTPYAELPESEKASDRDEADAILTIIRAWLDAQEPTP